VALRANTWKVLAGALIGSAVGVPLGLLLGSILPWYAVLAGLVVGLLGLMAVLVVMPTSEKRAAAEVLKEAKRFPDGTVVEVEDDDTVLAIDRRRRTPWGPCAVITKYSNQDWDEAFDEIGAGSGISTVSVTNYVFYRWLGPMQLTHALTVRSPGARLPQIEQEAMTRWSRYRRDVREQAFQLKTGQMKVTEAEMRFLAEALRRSKITGE
jgi:hypothetical protein